jgi:hypothetical protein
VSRGAKAKSALPAHAQDPSFMFGAPTRWASTAKDVMAPAPLSDDQEGAEALYKVSHRRLEPGQQRSSASWWQTAGVDPHKTVFGKPTSTKERDSVAQAMGASSGSSPSKKG